MRSKIVNLVDPILRNFSPPGVMMLRAHRLRLGAAAPQLLSLRVFKIEQKKVVLHARARFLGTDTSAVVAGRMGGGRVFAGAACIAEGACEAVETFRRCVHALVDQASALSQSAAHQLRL